MSLLPPDEIHLWIARHERAPADELKRFEAWLSDEELQRRGRYRRPQDQLRYLVGRGLMRRALERYTGTPGAQWQFELSRYGRPQPTRPAPFDVNLSHTRGLSVCAVGPPPLGADVEGPRSAAHLELADRYFAPEEVRQLRQTPAERQGELFLRIWCLKEAFIKADGRGLSIPLDSFCFELDLGAAPSPAARAAAARSELLELPVTPSPQHPPRLLRGGDAAAQHFFELTFEDARIAVAATSTDRPRLRLWHFS